MSCELVQSAVEVNNALGFNTRGLFLCLLANNVERPFVAAQSKKNGMSHFALARPFREFYLADHHWLDPVATLHFGRTQSLIPSVSSHCRKVIKGKFFNPNFV